MTATHFSPAGHHTSHSKTLCGSAPLQGSGSWFPTSFSRLVGPDDCAARSMHDILTLLVFFFKKATDDQFAIRSIRRGIIFVILDTFRVTTFV